jgi:hypothetical protein
MDPDTRPVDANQWGAWVREGAELWEVVRRSWGIFQRNTTEILDLVNLPSRDLSVALRLMGDDQEENQPFWEEFDQRLHNHVAAAVSLVDHTRRLSDHCETDAYTIMEEYRKRNDKVRLMTEAAFLRDLRNYLLHYGVPPVIQSLTFQRGAESPGAHHVIKLSSTRLLQWQKWKANSRAYLAAFGDRDGPVLGRDVATYANAMLELYRWLFEQRSVISAPGNIPSRFRIDSASQ